MAAGNTRISDVIVPEVFTRYVSLLTEEKSRLIQSGALARNAQLDEFLAGGGETVNVPNWNDLDNEDENISSSDESVTSSPKKITTAKEIAIRMSRNQSWSSSDLTAALAGEDPMAEIANKVGGYRARRLQKAFLATMVGVFADNDANDGGDMTNDIKGASYVPGTTDFSTEAFLDALLTMGDSQEDLSLVMVHSVVYNTMQKNNLIDFIPDARGETEIPTFLGRQVIVDDGVTSAGGVYETLIFAGGAVLLGQGDPKMPTEVDRNPEAGNGGGQELLYNRWEWCLHPRGFAFVDAATAGEGGPSNAATAGNLGAATSWDRVYPERKQVKIARLVTREA